MTIYTAKDGDRLDKIVYKHYGTPEIFSQVLVYNTKLDAILKAGDKVYLPTITIEAKKEDRLW
ncbi:MAG: tail protein X [Campylobacteraceae bacterium]